VKRILTSLLVLAAVGIAVLTFVGGATANDKGKEPPKPTATEGVKPTGTPEAPKPTATPEEPKPTATHEEPKHTPTDDPNKTPEPTHAPKDDSDADGCDTEHELGQDEKEGGRRDPKNEYDFYDQNGDKVINVFNDILPVALAYGPSNGKDYSPDKDRSPPPDAAEQPDPSKREPWDMGPPDGAINVFTDILGVATQFGHSCLGPPA